MQKADNFAGAERRSVGGPLSVRPAGDACRKGILGEAGDRELPKTADGRMGSKLLQKP